MEHLTDDLLLRFVREQTSRQENQQIVRHLLARCPTCAATLKRIWMEPPAALDRFEEQLPRLTARKPSRLTLLSAL